MADEKSELAATRETLESAKKSIDLLVGHLNDRLDRSRLVSVLLIATIAAVSVIGLAGWNDDRTDDNRDADRELAQLELSCRTVNESRQIIRDIILDGGIAAGIAGGEALIATAPDATPEMIEIYRNNLSAALKPSLTEVVNHLPDRRWDVERRECVDTPVNPDR